MGFRDNDARDSGGTPKEDQRQQIAKQDDSSCERISCGRQTVRAGLKVLGVGSGFVPPFSEAGVDDVLQHAPRMQIEADGNKKAGSWRRAMELE